MADWVLYQKLKDTNFGTVFKKLVQDPIVAATKEEAVSTFLQNRPDWDPGQPIFTVERQNWKKVDAARIISWNVAEGTGE